MLRTFTYASLAIGVVYFILYTSNGSAYAMAGNLLLLTFNAATLFQLQKEGHKWNLVQYLSAIPALVFIIFLGYSSVHLMFSAMKYDYFGSKLLLLITLSMVLALSGFSQFVFAFKRYRLYLIHRPDSDE